MSDFRDDNRPEIDPPGPEVDPPTQLPSEPDPAQRMLDLEHRVDVLEAQMADVIAHMGSLGYVVATPPTAETLPAEARTPVPVE